MDYQNESHTSIDTIGMVGAFLVSTKQIDKLDKNNEDISVNVLYFYQERQDGDINLSNVLEDETFEALTKQSKISILRRSDCNTTRVYVVNLRGITSGKKKCYTAAKNLSRLLTSLNVIHKGTHQFCMNCLNSFCIVSA